MTAISWTGRRGDGIHDGFSGWASCTPSGVKTLSQTALPRAAFVAPAVRTARRQPAPGGGHIVGFDLLRFAAAMMMALYHLAFLSWAHPASLEKQLHVDTHALMPLQPIAEFGWVGVEIFFVLSGFVIAFSARNATPGRFARGRVLRLAPGAWICSLLIAAIWLSLGRNPGDVALWTVNSMAFNPAGPWLSDVFWTLQVEVLFYIAVALVLWRFGFRHIETLAAVLGLYSLTFWSLHGAALAFDLGAAGEALRQMPRSFWSNIGLAQHGAFFALGIYLWLALNQGLTRGRVAALAVLPIVCLAEIVQETIKNDAYQQADLSLALPAAVWLASLAAMVLAVRFNGALKTAIAGRGEAMVRVAGLATFPLYLVHWPVGAAVLVAGAELGLSVWLSLPLALTAGVALSIVITRMAEPWLRGGLSAMWRSERRVVA